MVQFQPVFSRTTIHLTMETGFAGGKVVSRKALELPMKSKDLSDRLKQMFVNLLYLFVGFAAGYGLSFLLEPGRVSFITATIPESGEQIASTSSLSISFNQDVDQNSAEAAFRITPAFPGDFSWEGNTLVFSPSNPFAENQRYQLSLSTEVLSTNSMQSTGPLELQFTIRPASIIFLHPADESSQLWIVPSPYLPENAFQLTSTAGSVVDYTSAQDGSFLVYLAQNTEGLYSLWYLSPHSREEKLLQDFGTARCSFPTLSPQGNKVAFLRISPTDDTEVDNGLWILDIESGASTHLLSENADQWDMPAWSPDGTKLAFADAGIPGIRFLDVSTGKEEVLASSMGTSGSWSPDSALYLYSDLAMVRSQALGSIYQADLVGKSIKTLFPSEDSMNSYRVPVFSPDRSWLLAGVHNRSTGPGYQLVLYSYPDLESHQITFEPDYTHGAMSWHPSSRAFLFQKVENLNPDATPSIWLYNLESDSTMLIFENAFLPGWLP
ncbi:MAG: Ig-like domain-containing protein [Anaerolineales bacterium]|nr:Ig-like domain-containing protein [Anaerolineales bacterium]